MILGVLQARTSSTRLPRKVMLPIVGKPMLQLQIERVKRAARIDRLVLATSTDPSDDELEALSRELGIDVYRGSLDDVLDRFFRAAARYRPDHVVRLTGDCPLADPAVIDQAITRYLEGNFDYLNNTLVATFPDGLDVEVFRYGALETAHRNAILPSHREHVTIYIKQHPETFTLGVLQGERDVSALRWTVDEAADFEFVRRVYETLYPRNPEFSMADVLALVEREPSLCRLNAHLRRNEGLKPSLERDKLWIER